MKSIISSFVFALAMFCVGTISGCGGNSTPPATTTPSPTTGTISGTVTGATSGTVTCGSISATINTNGTYLCNSVPNGSVIVTPSVSGYNVSPTSTPVNVNGAAVSGINFTATIIPPTTWTVNAVAGTGTTVTPTSTTVQDGQSAQFNFGLLQGYTSLTVTGGNGTLVGLVYTTGPIHSNGIVVNSSATPAPTYSITGTVTGATGFSVTCGSVVAVVSGSSFTCSGLVNGTYTVMPTLANYTFSPSAAPVTINGTNGTAGNFVATVIPPGIDIVKKSLRAVYDADLLSTPICFQVQTHGIGFHVVVTRIDITSGETATLNDAGNNCDVTAGDGVFSGQLTMTSVPSLPDFNGKIGKLLFGVALVSNSTSATLVSEPTQLRVASVSLKGTVNTTQSGPFTIASSALFYDTPYTTSQQSVAQAVYGVVKDVYDGLAISESRSNNPVGTGTQDYVSIRQPAVYGTGITSFFDGSASYGSNGVLLGLIENDDGDAEWQSFDHETGLHMLGCCFASNSVLPFSNSGAHINNGTFTFHDGQMPTIIYLVQNSGGDYVATLASTAEFSQLAKYFGRIIPASAVPSPMCAAFNYTGPNPTPGTIIPAAKVTCFTIQDIIGQFGPVSPTRTTFNFNVLPVVRYEDGQMNDALVTSTQWMFSFYAGNTTCVYGTICSFSGAMKGDASLSTSVVLK